MSLTVENLCGLIIRSKLLTPEMVKALYSHWRETGKTSADLPEFTKWLVKTGHLTEYQATLLSNGHADNFFLGEYKIRDRIGHGRMAGVYKAVHTLGQVVAIKVLPPSRAKDPQLLARFQREARLAAQLDHPNVVRTFQYAQTNGLHYLVMEYLEGETLDTVLRERGKLPPPEAVRLAYLTALGLQHIHEKGLVHRDIKPGNLMLCPALKSKESTQSCTLKILDIGLGRELFDPKAKEPTEDLTVPGVIMGTPGYLAPEQARDAKRADIRADLYSLGCTLFHMLTAQQPFPEPNAMKQILRHTAEPAPPLQPLCPEAPKGLAEIVATLLSKDPAQRFQTPNQVAEGLKALLAGVTEPASPDSPELRKYLEWLKQFKAESDEPPAEPAGDSVPPPDGKQPVVAVAKPLPSAARVLKVQRRKARMKGMEPPPAEETAATPPAAKAPNAASAKTPVLELELEPLPETTAGSAIPEITVEPVSLADLTRAPFGLPIPRDLFMILLGALVMDVVIVILFLIMWLAS